METLKMMETAQYLTFRLDEEIFALDVIQVREVLDLITITKVPGTPKFMKGVINVRGSVVPVMDLRQKFGLPEAESTLETRIIVMELILDDEATTLGILADSVNEVIDLETGQIEPPPKIGMRWRTEFLKGIGKKDDLFLILLDIDRVFSTDELAILEKVSEAPAGDKHVDEEVSDDVSD